MNIDEEIFKESLTDSKLVDFNVTELFNLAMNTHTKGLNVIVYDLILMLLGVLLLYKFGYKRNLALYQEV